MEKVLIILVCATYLVQGICYFPAVYQGVYESQTVGGNSDVSYSSISVLYDSIPVWGYCYRRVGSNVILKEDSGGITCYRCFHLSLRSSNILQIHTKGLNKCFTTEDAALSTCVSQDEMMHQDASEIMMYRTKGFLGEPAVSPTYCPFNGEYTFTYSVNDGTENTLECPTPISEISDCPFGFGFNLQFKQCSFGDLEISFHCLGDWEGRDGERFVALMDTGASLTQGRPRYRCAIYKEDKITGKVKMALSSDSTCVSNLDSSERGYETMVLHPKESPSWPELDSSCIFPDWIQGSWEHVDFQGDTMVYKDHRNFKTYTGKCIPHSSGDPERFLVYTRTQCGDEVYKCIWIKERGLNTMEIQVSLYDSSTPDKSLCRDENFLDRAWTTQGRMRIGEKAPYMFTGEYTGVIPDTDGLCAKLYSDCNNPEIMFYTIFNCFNRTEVFEEREYECLGQWEENGVIYTYTERRDMIGHECFVGATTKKGEIYLQEAGNNCERGQEPLKDGMRMSRVAECYYHRQTNPRFNWREKSMVEPEPEIESGARDKNSNILLLPFLILIFIFI
ncbi:uncharacterized protein LOC111700851 [Eurytemora carolleeae]|uniref:uncharacterized protein LOC111700851 n=1 Tax=Eurytemora carolleeae TaxID=1294199 RepID=UPI000C78C4EB|nr:uncharacterized protein LOC111700851 [Eurytemora carolleeae]|eukprot:XP_023327677.1 uncharacterized protein LOC111700851 [Eurytemora affinis]